MNKNYNWSITKPRCFLYYKYFLIFFLKLESIFFSLLLTLIFITQALFFFYDTGIWFFSLFNKSYHFANFSILQIQTLIYLCDTLFICINFLMTIILFNYCILIILEEHKFFIYNVNVKSPKFLIKVLNKNLVFYNFKYKLNFFFNKYNIFIFNFNVNIVYILNKYLTNVFNIVMDYIKSNNNFFLVKYYNKIYYKIQKYSTNYSNYNYRIEHKKIIFLDFFKRNIYMNLLNNNLYIRNNKNFLKSKFIKILSFCKNIVFFCLLLNIIILNWNYYIFYNISINYLYFSQILYYYIFAHSLYKILYYYIYR